MTTFRPLGSPVHFTSHSTHIHNFILKQSWEVTRPGIIVLGLLIKQSDLISKRDPYTGVHSSSIRCSQTVEATQVPSGGWIYKLNTVHPNNRILLCLKREGNSVLQRG